MGPMAEPITDQRLVKGARSRAAIARHAADVASVEGLDGLSIGRLATDLGVSKSGIATLFGSKQALQLAAVRAAREVFIERIVEPAVREPRGLPRVRALVTRWLDYITDPVFPGGCFRAATLAEFDSRPGPVRDALVADHAEWMALLEKQLRHAVDRDELPGRDPAALAFELDALVTAANTARQLGDETKLATARAIIDRLLT
ncbi:TetR/AcrR family transcriptional regulator [Nocardia farcinica]|uniref:TetR/AcrR family transcriptional regulator n=1 Tax=Nocardia farcinica TaxID=37329 RepID=UPI001894C853|nr:TetR/AcrR family transcriptional regulator [Nocardia farcinica]MBF6385701.1 TetR/AcrR family transcriptional regulator [Nocardia farcinica]MBF6418577.1 TetR/AcrR family transcriptional regulator [Nocardia farcinica]MBF6430054.1 TetR/AcrR family transcriptional regulator [Nocardia farcinica]MBF6504537.1 TetR/AcrR family transcriptional regulator [Nocardia farcinica]MBF6540603.1 TetR/AcrR family transcriptional regulator [Nocardia farcinica]